MKLLAMVAFLATLHSSGAVCEFSSNVLTYYASEGTTAQIDVGQCTNPSPVCTTECISDITYETITYETVTCECPNQLNPPDPCEDCRVTHNFSVLGQDAFGNDIIVEHGATCNGTCMTDVGDVDMRLEISADDSVVGIWVDGVPLTLGGNSQTWQGSDTYFFSLDRAVDHVIAVHWQDVADGNIGLVAALYAIDQLSPAGQATSAPTWGTGAPYLGQWKAHLNPPAAGWEQPGFNDNGWTDVHYWCDPAFNTMSFNIPFVDYQTIWDQQFVCSANPAPYYCYHPMNSPSCNDADALDDQYFRWYITAESLQQASTSCVSAVETRTVYVPVLTSCECDCPEPTTACAHPTYWSYEQCKCVGDRGGLGGRSVDHGDLGY